MRLLERCVRFAAGPAREPSAQRSESTEARPLSDPVAQEVRFVHVSLEGLHTGGVIEASDVRGDERRKHRSKRIPKRLRRAYQELGKGSRRCAALPETICPG